MESKIELLKKMGAPKGDDGSSGLLDVIEEMQATLRKEFDDKLAALKDDLLKKIAEL